MVGKLVPDTFLKIKIEYISGSTVQNFIQFVLLHVQVDDFQNILKLKAFSENKTWHELVSLPHFLHDLWLTLYFVKWPNFVEILSNMCIVIICCPVTNLSILIMSFFYITKNQGKSVNISRAKRAFKMK